MSASPEFFALVAIPVVVASSIAIASRSRGPAKAAPEAPAPVLVLSETIGPVFPPPEGQVITKDFVISNPSVHRNLELKNPTKSCNCTDLLVDRTSIPPRSSARVTFKVRVLPENAEKIVRAKFETNDEQTPQITLDLKIGSYARVDARGLGEEVLVLEPGKRQSLAFSALTHDAPGERPHELVIRSESAGVHPRVTGRAVTESGNVRKTAIDYLIEVDCPKAPGASGPSPGDVALPNPFHVSFVSGDHRIDKEVRWEFRRSIRIAPSHLFVSLDRPTSRAFKVVMSSTKPFKILSVRPVDPFVRCEAVSDGVRSLHTLDVWVDETRGQIPRKATRSYVRVAVDHEDESVVEFSVNIVKNARL